MVLFSTTLPFIAKVQKWIKARSLFKQVLSDPRYALLSVYAYRTIESVHFLYKRQVRAIYLERCMVEDVANAVILNESNAVVIDDDLREV